MLRKLRDRHKNNLSELHKSKYRMPRLKHRLNSLIANKSKTTQTLNSTKASFIGTILTKKLSFYVKANIAKITPSCVENKLASAL